MNLTRRILTLLLVIVLAAATLVLPAAAAGSTVYGIGFVNASSLRLRSGPSDTASILDTAQRSECVVVLGKEGQWYQVSYNLQNGYMHESYLKVSTKENAELGIGVISGSGVNLRSGPSTASGISAVGNDADQCYIIGLNDGWYKVIYQEKTCYIRSDYLELTEIPYENRDSAKSPKYFRGGKAIGTVPTSPSASPAPQVSGAQILSEAQKYLGTRYVYGGASPEGFDCSGFVYYVLKQLGFSPYRTPADQITHGTAVEKASLKVGDLVFFSSTGGRSITHVGIYAGSGQFIHAPNSRSVVSYSDLTQGYWSNTYYAARRLSI